MCVVTFLVLLSSNKPVGSAQPRLLTALLEYLTVLLEYIYAIQPQWQGSANN